MTVSLDAFSAITRGAIGASPSDNGWNVMGTNGPAGNITMNPTGTTITNATPSIGAGIPWGSGSGGGGGVGTIGVVQPQLTPDQIIKQLHNMDDDQLLKVLKNFESFLKLNEEVEDMSFTDVEVAIINELKRLAVKVCENPPLKVYVNVPHILAGGCFTSWYHKQEPKDYDVFFLNCHSKNFIIDCFTDSFWETNKDHLTWTDPKAYWPNAENLAEIANLDWAGSKYQFIFTKYQTREELMSEFDYIHTQVSYASNENKLYISRATYDAIKNKKLVPNKNVKPQLWRANKFTAQGWSV